jgi:hypothetical protein
VEAASQPQNMKATVAFEKTASLRGSGFNDYVWIMVLKINSNLSMLIIN